MKKKPLDEDISSPPSIRKVVLASFIGTTIEWYDFFLYGTAAALVFNQLFFPTFEPLTGTTAIEIFRANLSQSGSPTP